MTSSCEACRADSSVLEDNEIQELLSQIPSWRVFEEDGIKKIICSFVFLNYDDSRNFLNKIADLADEEDHHPEMTLEWGKVTVAWWSHKIKDLHQLDLDLATKCDEAYQSL